MPPLIKPTERRNLSLYEREKMTRKNVLAKLPKNWEEIPQPPGKMLFRSGDNRFTIYIRRNGDNPVYEVESARHKPVENPEKHPSDTGFTVIDDSVSKWHIAAEWETAVETVIGFMKKHP